MGNSTLLCLAYIAGLLLTGLNPWLAFTIVGLVALTLGIQALWPQPRLAWSVGKPLAIGLILILAFAPLYFQVRTPQPSAQDISQQVAKLGNQTVTVQGVVEELPRLTRSQKMQTWLRVGFLEVQDEESPSHPIAKPAIGKLYVTVPQGQGADLVPGQKVRVKGILYKPQPAVNPGGFDFQQYLARSGSFAGLRGEELTIERQPEGWGLWQWQRRIVRSQAAQLPYPEGAILSAMVLGSQGVDIPWSLKDQFARVGLSHALAASGFQTSLILGVVLGMTQGWPKKGQVVAGAMALLLFLGLTGMQPSVLRAGVMGGAVLVGIWVDRSTKPLGSLLFAAVLLLVVNPLWIWDLGFELSVMATLGLLVSVPWMTKRLDWMPNRLQPMVAVPLAAMFWTMPLQIYLFGVVSPYALLANLVTTPLISILSLGGMVSGLVALLHAQAGSLLASWLHFPCAALIWLVDLFCKLPGSAVAIGTISATLLIAIYSAMVILWKQTPWQRYGGYVALAIAALIFLPAAYRQTHIEQVTALSTGDQPVLVVQHRGQTGLVNSGGESTAQMTVLPFLQQQGINKLHWGLATTQDRPEENGWGNLGDRLDTHHRYHLQGLATPGPTLTEPQHFGPVTLAPIHEAAASIEIGKTHWLLLPSSKPAIQEAVLDDSKATSAEVLWWNGGGLSREFVHRLRVKGAIAYGKKLNAKTQKALEAKGVQVFWIKRDGAVRWISGQGFQTHLGDGR